MEVKNTKEIFRKRLFELMEEREIAASELADALGISRTRLSKIKHGVTGPALDTALLLCGFFNVSVEYMAGVCDTYDYNPNTKAQVTNLLMTFERLNKKNPHEYDMIQKIKQTSEKLYKSDNLEQNAKLAFDLTTLMEVLEARNLEERQLLDELRTQLTQIKSE